MFEIDTNPKIAHLITCLMYVKYVQTGLLCYKLTAGGPQLVIDYITRAHLGLLLMISMISSCSASTIEAVVVFLGSRLLIIAENRNVGVSTS